MPSFRDRHSDATHDVWISLLDANGKPEQEETHDDNGNPVHVRLDEYSITGIARGKQGEPVIEAWVESQPGQVKDHNLSMQLVIC